MWGAITVGNVSNSETKPVEKRLGRAFPAAAGRWKGTRESPIVPMIMEPA